SASNPQHVAQQLVWCSSCAIRTAVSSSTATPPKALLWRWFATWSALAAATRQRHLRSLHATRTEAKWCWRADLPWSAAPSRIAPSRSATQTWNIFQGIAELACFVTQSGEAEHAIAVHVDEH